MRHYVDSGVSAGGLAVSTAFKRTDIADVICDEESIAAAIEASR